MRHLRILLPLFSLAVLLVLIGCGTPAAGTRAFSWESRLGPVPVERKTTPVGMLREVNLKQDMIRKGTVGRRVFRPMRPRYITIHSTQNYTGDAYNHALALKRGALRATKRRGGNRIGYLTWHFTTQSNVAIQHIPTNEQGEHADFDGPGNNYSIGIEMCEHRGNDLALTIDKTAKLTAFLMYEHQIPLSNVVGHYHWPRRGLNPPNKNCPHFLLDNGRPGPKWRWFLSRVKAHYERLVPGPVPRI
ncbi:N-acetylmuramoyl-L-alanine amidase [Phragmitibacter flavus]|uniref:N-acetylmuramoyl-L-alanine amidase n=1 Tax=Phragmitibacter flavus TaxID=2576071 RepID=A0A5R8KIJ8_9BACT|nr:N-acetylmuramoyl-L-alanine amidase [Phragmitibacter flavus]